MTAPAARYSKIPITTPPGSLGASFRQTMDGFNQNTEAITQSIDGLIQNVKDLDAADTALTRALEQVKKATTALGGALTVESAARGAEDARLLSRGQDYVLLTAASGGSAWVLSALTGYPYFRAVVINPNGESNTLTLPTLGAGDKAVFTIKCLNGGSVAIAGAANIISSQSPGGALTLPLALAASGITVTTYSATLLWTGSAWHVIDTAVLAF